jgi:Tfp pilus assembly protein PilF
LNRIEGDPRAWNNLGVAYVRLGDTAKAMEYFQKAVDQGDSDAEANLQELQKYLDSL